ncbi:MAG: hypothetical protein WCA37_08290 [Terracidiphilus sp.]
MKRVMMTALFLAGMTWALHAQQAGPTGPYEGVSHPPSDDTIQTTADSDETIAKPSAAHRAVAQTQPAAQKAPAAAAPHVATKASSVDGTDAGIVVVPQSAPSAPVAEPQLKRRIVMADPDGDIVHPAPLPADVVGEGTSIRVELMEDLSSNFSKAGEPFRSRVATDVMSSDGSHVLIPAGAEIDGTVVDASAGHFASYGSLQLRPETVKLPDGKIFRLDATVTDAPVSKNTVHAEGMIGPGSQVRRDSIEYGGAVGTGALAGAYLGGPVGALAGGLIGAGLVTTHLLVSHPQARLDAGTPLILTLNENMRLAPTEGLEQN